MDSMNEGGELACVTCAVLLSQILTGAAFIRSYNYAKFQTVSE